MLKKADHILEMVGYFVILVSSVIFVKLDCLVVSLIVNYFQVFLIGLFFNFFCKMFYRFSSKSPDFLFCCCFLFIVCFHILATCRLVAPESKPIIQRRLMLVPCETK